MVFDVVARGTIPLRLGNFANASFLRQSVNEPIARDGMISDDVKSLDQYLDIQIYTFYY